jgi:hypothetical protein
MTLGSGEIVALILAGIPVVVWLVRLEGKINIERQARIAADVAEKSAREADARVDEVQRKSDVEAVNVKLGNLSLACGEGRRDHGNRILELEILVGRRATIFREEGK